jgi:two-component system chemotaxis response regulator CheB
VPTTSVLVVDDSALMRRVIKGILEENGFEVRTARNGVDALEQLTRVRHDLPCQDHG